MAMAVPGKPSLRLVWANIQALVTMNTGFRNSEGWIAMPPTNSQRCEPLISGANIRVARVHR